MDSFVPYFPKDIQNLLLEELPYTVLSKKYKSGMNRFKSLCYKDVSKLEFINYIIDEMPNKFVIYYNQNGYNYIRLHVREGNFYTTRIEYYKILNNITTSQYPLLKDGFHIDDIDEYMIHFNNPYYDIFSVNNILNRRKGCDTNLIKKYMFDKYTKIDIELNDIDRVFNEMNAYAYLKGIYLIYHNTENNVLSLGLIAIVRRSIFNNGDFGNQASVELEQFLIRWIEEYENIITELNI